MIHKDSYNKFFGKYGGSYVPEMLVPALDELDDCFRNLIKDQQFFNRVHDLFTNYVGRPSRLYKAVHLSRVLKEEYGSADNINVYLKLESHNHTGAHKINNVVGQILLAEAMGKTHIVAETGAGQHGLATASVCAKFGIKCTVFMGEVDMRRQYPNVFAMKQMGAEVIAVTEGSRTLKDAVNAALKYWVEHVEDTHYLLGSALGPYPYPQIVQFFQSIIGEETKTQILEVEKRLPDVVMACVGGGSNAIGMFTEFLDEEQVQLIGIEAGGYGLDSGKHASRFGAKDAEVGIAQGYKSYFLQNEDGQLSDTHSISAGLDYAGISPQLADLYERKRVRFLSATDDTAIRGYQLLSRTEGMIPALETSHALGALADLVSEFTQHTLIVVNVSGRGDKDLFIVAPHIDRESWVDFLNFEIERNKK